MNRGRDFPSRLLDACFRLPFEMGGWNHFGKTFTVHGLHFLSCRMGISCISLMLLLKQYKFEVTETEDGHCVSFRHPLFTRDGFSIPEMQLQMPESTKKIRFSVLHEENMFEHRW